MEPPHLVTPTEERNLQMEGKKDAIENADVPFNLAAVSIQTRLLPFWREYPRLWFVQFEALVDPLKTSDENKYRYVLGQLQPTDLQQLSDILLKPPATGKFAAIKERLLSVYEQSEIKNFKHLVSGLELGDQKPTQLLRRMRELGGSMITEDGIRIEWLNQLPQQVRVVLSINTDSSLDMLAAMADKMLEYSGSGTVAAVTRMEPISSTSAGPSQQAVVTQFDVLSKQLEKLTLEVAELHARGRSQYRRPFHSRSRSSSARKIKEGTWLCRFHFKYGDRARRCESPCARSKSKSEN